MLEPAHGRRRVGAERVVEMDDDGRGAVGHESHRRQSGRGPCRAAEAHRARPNGEREGKPVERCCTPVMRACALSLAGLLCLGACAHSLTAEQEAVLRRGDCAELLRAADAARARDRGGVASSLANACSQQGLSELVAKAADPRVVKPGVRAS